MKFPMCLFSAVSGVCRFSDVVAMPRLLACIAMLLFGLANNPLRAENLMSIKTQVLAPLAASEPISRLLVIDGKPLAIGTRSAWILNADRTAWSRIDWRGDGRDDTTILCAAGDGQRAFVALGSLPTRAVGKLARLSLSDDARTLQSPVSLPSLPTPLANVHCALMKNTWYVAGRDSTGRVAMFALNVAAAPATWTALGGPPGMDRSELG